MRRGRAATSFRILVPLATFAAVLGPPLAAPAEMISVPVTLAGEARPALGRAVALDFPATHVAFSWTSDRMRAVRFRTIDGDGIRTRWLRAPEAHDLEGGGRHFSGVHWVGRVERLEWRPVERPGARPSARVGPAPEHVTVDYMNTLDGPRRLVQVPATADAAARTPDIVTRAQWGANESLKRTAGGCRRVFHPLQQLFVHHTAGSNFDPHPRATMRAIYHFHVRSRGWCDIGYNFVISPKGTVFEGRWARRYAPWETHDSEDRSGRVVTGAHVGGFNSGSLGVSMMGNYSQISLPPGGRRSLAEVLAWEADRHDLRPLGVHTYRNPETGRRKRLPVIAGHRNAGSTECPGNLLYRSLDRVRRDTRAVMGDGKAETATTLATTTPRISYRDSVSFAGRLTNDSGVGLGSRPITIYRRPAGGTWGRAASLTTLAGGDFTFSLRPHRNITVVAVYHGGRSTWGSESPRLLVAVRPDVSLETRGGEVNDGITFYDAGTTTVPLVGSVAPPHPTDAVRVRVLKADEQGDYGLVVGRSVALNARSGYRFPFRRGVSAGGTFRAVTWFRPDGDHAFSRSRRVHFVVQPSN